MTKRRLLLRNLVYHWRGNLAVFLGVAVGGMVLVGSLLVGDSLRGSLRDLTLRQLGWVHHAMLTGRFFREDLAADLGAGTVRPLILLQGSARSQPSKTAGDNQPRAVGKVTIFGVDSAFWSEPAPVSRSFWMSTEDGAVLNESLASVLGVKTGDTVVLNLQKASNVPRESLLGRRETSDVVEELSVKVVAVLPDGAPEAGMNLSPSPVPPRNAFLPLHALQSRLGLQGRVNALLAGESPEDLQVRLAKHLTIDDWGLMLNDPQSRARSVFTKLDRNNDGKLSRTEWRGRLAESFVAAADTNKDESLTFEEIESAYRRLHPYFSLESRQMLLEPAVAEAATKAASETKLQAAPTLVYLANSITTGSGEIPYSIVAALDPTALPPLGPFLPADLDRLSDEQIILADWPESPLKAKAGDEIRLTYFQPEESGRLQERTATFRLAGMIPLQGAANDPDLTPEFPGITDKLDLRDWNPPFPYDNKRVKKRDEDYWRVYRTTPKAYVTLATGQRLWSSRFGNLTSIRLAPASGTDELAVLASFRKQLLSQLDPKKGGFVFDDLRKRSLEASAGGTDFSGLFIGFSFFLIVAALLLVGLLFRLNLDRRAAEIGLLLAAGYRRATVRRLLLAEGGLIAIAGAVLGSLAALAYTWALLDFLRTWWPGTLDRSFLKLHVTTTSIVIGYVSALAVTGLTILWALRVLAGVAPSALLRGETMQSTDSTAAGAGRRSMILLGSSTVFAIVCIALAGFVHDQEMHAGTFFGSGMFVLIAGLTAFWRWMLGSQRHRVRGTGWQAITRLGIRNATRNPVRSLLTAGLLASASFLIVAVDSFRRQADDDFLSKNAGSGGFSLLAESNVPIYQDMTTPTGQDELNFSNAARAALKDVPVYAIRRRVGDDASCLNLFQPQRPRILGVPKSLIERGGFHFQATEATATAERQNPWVLLCSARDDGAIPVFGEANTVQWMLHRGLGDELKIPDEKGNDVRLRIVGLLKDSVFQSELLMSDDNFLKLFPGHEGYNYFLIEAPADRMSPISSQLSTALADHGLEVTPTADRLNAYLAVENTYLSTFQALGGLGLVLGSLGLAVVLLRSVWERRGELALLRAVGYRHAALGWMIFAENSFLLAFGLALGTLAALLAVAPHLFDHTGSVAIIRLVGWLLIVFVVGLTAGALAVVSALRTPLIPALRRE